MPATFRSSSSGGSMVDPVTSLTVTATAVGTTASTTTTPFGFTSAVQADSLCTAVNALIADVAAIRAALRQLG